MGGQKCPNCQKGILIRKGKKRQAQPMKRCASCGYWKYDSPRSVSPGSMIGAQELSPREKEDAEMKKKMKEEEEEQAKTPKIPYPLNSREYKQEKEMRDQYITDMRKSMSIRKLIKKLGHNKYSGLRGKDIEMEGAMWKVGEDEQPESNDM